MPRNNYKSALLSILLTSCVSITVLAQSNFEGEKTVFFASNPMSTREINIQNIYLDTEDCRRLRDQYLNSSGTDRSSSLHTYRSSCMNPSIDAIRQAFKALMQSMSRDLRRNNVLAEFVTYPYKNRLSSNSPIKGKMEHLNTNLSLIVKKRIEIEYKKKVEKSAPKKNQHSVQAEKQNLDFFEEEEESADWEFEYNEQIRDLFDQTYQLLTPEGKITAYDFNGLRPQDKKGLSAIFSHFYFIKQKGKSKKFRTILFRLFLYDLKSWTGEDDDIHPLYFKITSKSDFTQTAGGYKAAMARQLRSILDDFVRHR
jgi:hypothetical protein